MLERLFWFSARFATATEVYRFFLKNLLSFEGSKESQEVWQNTATKKAKRAKTNLAKHKTDRFFGDQSDIFDEVLARAIPRLVTWHHMTDVPLNGLVGKSSV